MILRSATLVDHRVVDVRVADGLIAEIGQVERRDSQMLDLEGRLLLPGLVESHLHLDTAFSAGAERPGERGLEGAIEHWLEARAHLDGADVYERAVRALTLAGRRGVTAMRAHADVGDGIELRALEALLAVREEWRGVIDLELVAMADATLTGGEGARGRAWLETALEAGADVVGGAPGLDPDPPGCLELLLGVAAAAVRPIDLHIDETLDPGSGMLDEFVRAVIGTGFDLPATASHCASLGMRPESEQRELAAAVTAAGIAVIALPATNLYLLGRDYTTARPRGITALESLKEAGVIVAAGTDNVRDDFNPVGTPDPLRTAGLLVIAGQTSAETALRAVTEDARRVLRLPTVDLRPGSPADLVAVTAATLDEALADASEERLVLKNGQVVAQSILEITSPSVGLRRTAPA